MRDIGWLCKFMVDFSNANRDLHLQDWSDKYYYGMRILAIEGVNYLMGENNESSKLLLLKDEIL